jgi:hypothetical protein
MKRLIAFLLAAAGLLTAGSALAWGYYPYGPRFSLGFAYGYPGPFWGPAWYPGYYYPPAVIVTTPPQPVQYIERPQAAYTAPAPVSVPQLAPAHQSAVQSAQQGTLQPGYWYYCDSPQGFYPTVKECPTPWKAVPPGPPPAPPTQ